MTAALWPPRQEDAAARFFGPPPWTEFAACQFVDSEIFFPEKGGSVRDAKRVCAGCAVSAECLEYALANEEKFGVWAGTSEAQRRRILASRRAGPAPLCKAGLHPMAGTNILALGECLGCRHDREARQRNQAQMGRAA